MKTPYKLSKDYEALFELISAEHIIPAFVNYQYNVDDSVFRDICKIKRNKHGIDFGCRGKSYCGIYDFNIEPGSTLKETFIKHCERLNVEYIDHNLHLHYETVNSILTEKLNKWIDKLQPDKDPEQISMSPEARAELMADLEEINDATMATKQPIS